MVQDKNTRTAFFIEEAITRRCYPFEAFTYPGSWGIDWYYPGYGSEYFIVAGTRFDFSIERTPDTIGKLRGLSLATYALFTFFKGRCQAFGRD